MSSGKQACQRSTSFEVALLEIVPLQD